MARLWKSQEQIDWHFRELDVPFSPASMEFDVHERYRWLMGTIPSSQRPMLFLRLRDKDPLMTRAAHVKNSSD